MLKRKKTLSKLLATTMVLTSFTVNASAAEVNTSTIGGNDRYETAIKISENGWSSSDRAVLINGEKGLVDALTATPYAYAKNAPILITAQGKLTTSTKNRLSAMNVKNVDIVGGVNSVSNQVVNDLKNMGITVNRISGASRYDTSLAVAKEVDKIQDVSEIAVVNGDKGIPDAVSVAAPAASKKMPILLAENGGLNSASKDFVNGESVSKSYVIGSSNSVSDSVMNSLPGTKTRLGGADRHDTNAAVIKEFYTASSLSNVYVAKSGYVKNNDEIVDALAAGVLAAKNGNPVVLVGNSINSSQQTLLAGKKFTKLTQIGMGVPANSVNQIKATQAEAESIVSSITVKSYNTILLKGKLLNHVTVSLPNNSVKAYNASNDGTELTVEFNKGFSENNALSVRSNLGNTTTHSFKYSTEIKSVIASTKEVSNIGVQYLQIQTKDSSNTVVTRTVDELKALGWDVEFKSKDQIFYSSEGNKNTSKDGKLKLGLDVGDTFYYEVILTKGDLKLNSEKTVFEVTNKNDQYKSIESFELKRYSAEPSKQITLNSKVFYLNEEFDITNVRLKKNNNLDDSINTLTKNPNGFEVKSSNPSVVSVSGKSADKFRLKAESKGKSTITITNGNVSKTFEINVVTEVRKPTKVSYSKTDIYISSKTETKVSEIATVLDQNNDPYPDYKFNIKDRAIQSDEDKTEQIAQLSLDTTDVNGKANIDVTPVLNAKGVATVEITNVNDKWGNIKLNVDKVESASTAALELNNKLDDTTLDVYQANNDNTLSLIVNQYNGSYLIGKVSSGISDKKQEKGYSVISSNEDVAKVAISSGTITVTAAKNGSADIQLYDGNTLKNKITVNVVDKTPKVTSISLNDVSTITKTGLFNPVKELLKLTGNVIEGVYVSNTSENILYNKDTTKNYAELKLATSDKVVAKIVVDPKYDVIVDENGSIEIEEGIEGSILVKFYINNNPDASDILIDSPYITKTININTK